MPRPDDPQSFNRYSYVRNNPLRYVDPSGHFDIPSELHDFLAGANYALLSANALLVDQSAQHALLNYTQPLGAARDANTAYQLGQFTGNALAIVQGAAEISAGVSISGSGAAACGTGVLCLAGAPALAGGVALVGHGAAVAAKGSTQLAEQVTHLQISATTLRKNMEAQGTRFGFLDSAHHIVPRNISYGRAADGRKILAEVGIDIDDAVNGVKLPWFRHRSMGLHTKGAVEEVVKRLERAPRTKEGVTKVLDELRREIEAGSFTFGRR